MLAVLAILSTLHPTSALADDVDLFPVYKPVNRENVLYVQARTNACKPINLDFMWHMGNAKSNSRSAGWSTRRNVCRA